MKKKIISIVLLSSLLLSGCSLSHNIDDTENKKYIITLYTYQGAETYECEKYSLCSENRISLVTTEGMEMVLNGTYKIEK